MNAELTQANARLALIIPAAGASIRMGGEVRKPWMEFAGLPIICHTLKRFNSLRNLEQVIIAAHQQDIHRIKSNHWLQLRQFGATNLIAGGERRMDTVELALNALHPDIDVVLIHDAVRPFVPRESILESISAAIASGAAVVAMPVTDTLKRAAGDTVAETVPRDSLWLAQTPQTFKVALIRRAFDAARNARLEFTDDAQLVERLGLPVRIVRGSYENIKITTPEHLRMAELLFAQPEFQ